MGLLIQRPLYPNHNSILRRRRRRRRRRVRRERKNGRGGKREEGDLEGDILKE